MELTEKEKAILCVLYNRLDACDTSIRAHEKEIAQRQKQIDYLRAKSEGYKQAIELVKDSLECIKIEL